MEAPVNKLNILYIVKHKSAVKVLSRAGQTHIYISGRIISSKIRSRMLLLFENHFFSLYILDFSF